jgi:hypothetical protein
MRAEHRCEHLLVDGVAPRSTAGGALAHAAFDLAPLQRDAAEACIACGSHSRRLWHGVCGWCGADLEDLEALEQD